MTITANPNRNPEHFQKLMGAGGMTMSAPRPVKQDSARQPKDQAEADSQWLQETIGQIGQEAKEQMSGYFQPETTEDHPPENKDRS